MAEQGGARAPVVTTQEPRSPWVPSALTMKGCLDGLERVRNEGRRKPAESALGLSSRVRTRKTVPGGRRHRWSAGGSRRARKEEGAFYRWCQTSVSPIGAPLLTAVRDKAKEGGPPHQ